ncbi:excisionase family DNA-binding protein [Fibrobacter sp. UWH4]|uniref:excisionase family DNA-binding protein n=1 Tax=Fibrobacter sp. UWH4 TaxID=1896210 RepID=UPI0009247854|nr:DNA binding domain-containing protein, excisionase family [Fibrobacter sp. UWH4]
MASKEQMSLHFDYYSVKEIANKIGFHPDTVYDWIKNRNMPVRRVGRQGRITIYWPDFAKWWSEPNNF